MFDVCPKADENTLSHSLIRQLVKRTGSRYAVKFMA